MAEQRTFVFFITYIILFSALISAIPIGLNGDGATPDELTPLVPDFSSGFANSVDWQPSDMTGGVLIHDYTYSLNGRYWIAYAYVDGSLFNLGAKKLLGGVLWLGGMDYVDFISPGGKNIGSDLTIDDITADAEEGSVIYSIKYVTSGNSAGSFIIYWNSTLYTDPQDAWDNDVLYFMHGVGFENTATVNVAVLLLQLLTLTIPGVPILLGLIVASPMYGGIVFLIWYIIKETTPFL